MAAGYLYTLFIGEDKKVYGLGTDTYDQLGDNSTNSNSVLL